MSCQLRLSRFELPFRNPLRVSTGEVRARAGVRLTLTDVDGRVGLGEATPWIGPGRETVDRDERLLVEIAPRLADRRFETAEAIDRALHELPALDRAPTARFALETALLDLAGQRAGAPVSALLSRSAVREVPVNALLGGDSPDALEAEAAQLASEGYGTVKVKIGARSIEEDLERLEAVRRGAPSVRIRVDANGAWTAEQAERGLETLGRLGIDVCEQPVAAEDFEGLRRLRNGGCGIAADEALLEPGAADVLLGPPAGVDAFVLKPAWLGGAVRTLALARRAAEVGVNCWVTCGLDGEVARAAAFHAACALPMPGHAHGLAVGRLFTTPVENGWLEPRGGTLVGPDRPGLGIEVRG